MMDGRNPKTITSAATLAASVFGFLAGLGVITLLNAVFLVIGKEESHA